MNDVGRMYKDIIGIEKLININPQFSWNKIKYLESFEYF